MNIEKVPKAFASFRLSNEVKRTLEIEAADKGLSFSKYIEEIIDYRFETGDTSNLQILQLESEIQVLEAEVESLNEELDLAQLEDSEFESEYPDSEEFEDSEVEPEEENFHEVSTTHDALQMSEVEQEQFTFFIEKLLKVYPNIPSTKLLLGALDTTLRTESAIWFVPTINEFLNQNHLS